MLEQERDKPRFLLQLAGLSRSCSNSFILVYLDKPTFFNSQFIKIQKVWETFAAQRPYVTALNLLGTTQVAGGNKKATIGSPDLYKFGPAKYWPDTLACIHPSTTGGDASGAMVIMEQFYHQFWSKALSC